MLGIQGSCFNVQDSHLVWVVFQVFQPTNDIQRSYITLQQSSIFWRASQWIHLGPAMTLVTFTRPCPLKKSFRRLSVCKLLSISKAGPLIKKHLLTQRLAKCMWGYPSIGHKSLMNLWNKLYIISSDLSRRRKYVHQENTCVCLIFAW